MEILAINGSPRGKRGHTAVLLDYFLEGAAANGAQVEIINLAKEKIHTCTGEFHCWLTDTGECMWDDKNGDSTYTYTRPCMWDDKNGDSMKSIRMKLAKAEHLVVATPVYTDGMTGLMKNMFDRCMPGMLPYVELDENGEFRHPSRYVETGKKTVLLSTCGFPELETFDPLVLHVERIMRNMDSKLVGKVLRPNTFMLPFDEFLGDKLKVVFAAIKQAGAEFASTGRVEPETEEQISMEFLPKEMFVAGAKMFWDKAIEHRGFKPLKKG